MTVTDATPAAPKKERWTYQWKELYSEVITSGLCTGCAGCVVACPHDVLGYPSKKGALANGYTEAWLKGDITLPATVFESLDTKPGVQQQFLDISKLGMKPLHDDQERLNYINFYGNLMMSSDHYLVRILNLLDELASQSLVLESEEACHLKQEGGRMGIQRDGCQVWRNPALK